MYVLHIGILKSPNVQNELKLFGKVPILLIYTYILFTFLLCLIFMSVDYIEFHEKTQLLNVFQANQLRRRIIV